MTTRTTSTTVAFRRPFRLKGVDRLLPPASYRVVTDEELIEGLSFPAYRRVWTAIFVPAGRGAERQVPTTVPMPTVSPACHQPISSSSTSRIAPPLLVECHGAETAPLPLRKRPKHAGSLP